jgi:hypothetical protein
VTPLSATARVPIHTRLPIRTGALIGRALPPTVSKSLSRIWTSHDTVHSAPMLTSLATRILVSLFTFVA